MIVPRPRRAIRPTSALNARKPVIDRHTDILF
ncbi:hypothetical protein FG93_01922 [Bosea sp. LC85]|nr:hypothetical protein FG93_01922 [Bosea sp. LC85]